MNILIIGASGGLGSNISKTIYPLASKLILTSTDIKKIKFKKKNVLKFKLNFKNDSQIKKLLKGLIKKFKHIDVVIITSGIFSYDKNLINFKNMINFYKINVFGHAVLINEFYKLKKKNKKTYIFSIGSSSALKNFPDTSLYCSSKHAMDSIIKSLNFKTKKKNIFNTLVHTGSLKTKMGKKIKKQNYNNFINPQIISNKIKFNIIKKIYKEEIKILRKNV